MLLKSINVNLLAALNEMNSFKNTQIQQIIIFMVHIFGQIHFNRSTISTQMNGACWKTQHCKYFKQLLALCVFPFELFVNYRHTFLRSALQPWA